MFVSTHASEVIPPNSPSLKKLFGFTSTRYTTAAFRSCIRPRTDATKPKTPASCHHHTYFIYKAHVGTNCNQLSHEYAALSQILGLTVTPNAISMVMASFHQASQTTHRFDCRCRVLWLVAPMTIVVLMCNCQPLWHSCTENHDASTNARIATSPVQRIRRDPVMHDGASHPSPPADESEVHHLGPRPDDACGWYHVGCVNLDRT
ncbi:hypothetical protein GGR57DRAFT_455120 [Xylariaceae sp. FL1272]|nr:hypothetical protein GGR57DRAFT_455120 [Xylariaceae sp. FL1272]